MSKTSRVDRVDCTCDDPFPCVFPVPDKGVECDNCGNWLDKNKGDQAGKLRFSSAFMSKTPKTDREVYRVQAADIGFEVVNPALARELEEKYNAALRALIIARETIKGYEFTLLASDFLRSSKL